MTKKRQWVYNKLNILENNSIRKLIFIPITFTIVCFAWIFFRANSLDDALLLTRSINFSNIENFTNGKIYELGLIKPEFILSLIAVGLLVVFEWTHKKINFQQKLSQQFIVVRWGVYMAIVLTILIFGIYGEGQVSEFIYFQF